MCVAREAMRQIAPRSVVSLLLIALRSADVNSRPSMAYATDNDLCLATSIGRDSAVLSG